MAKVLNLVPKAQPKAAEFYASQFGWRVFPLYEVHGGVCSCKAGAECRTPGKHPRIGIPPSAKGEHPATADVKQIREWWRKWPTANIGVWLAGSNIVVLDIDKNDKKDGFAGLADIMAFEEVKDMPDTLTCLTPSGGVHHYFQFCEGVPNKANALGPGLDTWHSGHYVIVPPSTHVKGVYRWKDGGAEQPVAFPEWLKPKARTAAAGSGGVGKKGRGRPPKEHFDAGDPEEVARLKHALGFVDNTDRDRWVMVGFALARAFDWSDEGFAVYDAWSKDAHNYDAKKTAVQYFKQSKVKVANPITTASIFEWAKEHHSYKGFAVNDERVHIRERPEDERLTLGEMADVIPLFPIYQRASKMVEIVPVNQDTSDDGNWFPKGSYMLREVQAEQLASRILPQKVRWLRKTPKGWKAGRVSVPLCSVLLGIGNWPTAHKLRAFVQHPTLRDDGSLLKTVGYDRQSGLFLTDHIDVQVKDKPTRADAIKAYKTLVHPFAEYKWIDGALSQVAFMSALFTVGIRHLFDDGVPLFAVDAPRQGSGKTKLVKAISNLWFGRPMATTPYSSDQEEMKKHLASMLLNGDRVVLFDNVSPTTKVNDPTLNALLTSGRATFRELGSQRMLDLDSAATFFMTGNNLKIVGDMLRRTLRMQIDPEGLHPMNRKFKIDPLEGYVLEHRTELLSAALTILTAFFRAGCPKADNSPALASFESWSNILRNMLLWLDLDDLKESVAQGYDQDDESMEIEHLLRVLFEIAEMNGDGLTSAMLLPMVENNKALKDAMLPFISERAGGIYHPRVVTTALQQVAKIAVDGRRLLRLGPVWVVREEE